MQNLNNEEELNRTKVLMDIYKNENDQLKHEYRVLFDYAKTLEKKCTELEQLIKNSKAMKISSRLKKCLLVRALRKIIRK